MKRLGYKQFSDTEGIETCTSDYICCFLDENDKLVNFGNEAIKIYGNKRVLFFLNPLVFKENCKEEIEKVSITTIKDGEFKEKLILKKENNKTSNLPKEIGEVIYWKDTDDNGELLYVNFPNIFIKNILPRIEYFMEFKNISDQPIFKIKIKFILLKNSIKEKEFINIGYTHGPIQPQKKIKKNTDIDQQEINVEAFLAESSNENKESLLDEKKE